MLVEDLGQPPWSTRGAGAVHAWPRCIGRCWTEH